MLRLPLLLLSFACLVAGQDGTAPPPPPGNGTSPVDDGPLCDLTVYHITPQGSCKLCPENCPKECNPFGDKYQVFNNSDCDGEPLESEGDEVLPICDTTVFHVSPQGSCKKCGQNCPPECRPDSHNYLVYEAEDCDGNGEVDTDDDDERPQQEVTADEDQGGETTATADDSQGSDEATSGSLSRDKVVAFMEVLIVSLPLVLIYWPFD